MNKLSLLPPIGIMKNWNVPSWISLFFSFEMAFLLFLFAGRYKSNPYLVPIFPIDPIIIFGLISFALVFWIIGTERLYIPGFIALTSLLVFIVWMWITMIWSPGIIYAREKALQVTVLDSFCLIAGAIIMANSRERFGRFVVALNIFALAMGLLVLWEFIRLGAGHIIQLNEGGDDYLGFGRVCGLATMTLFGFLATSRRLFTGRNLLLLALVAFFMWVLLSGGGRGPLVATLGPLLLVLPLGIMLRGRRFLVRRGHLIILVGLILVITAIVWMLFDPDMAGKSATLNRFSRLFSENQGKSDHRRITQVWEFLQLTEQASIFGHGVGAWPLLTYGADIRHHPHSLPLEVLGELGVVGLILFAIVCFTCLRLITVERLRQDPLMLTALLMTLNTALNAGTSGDLGENRYLFLTMGLLLVRPPISHGALSSEAGSNDRETDNAGFGSAVLDDRESYLAIRRRLSSSCSDDPAPLGRRTVSSSEI